MRIIGAKATSAQTSMTISSAAAMDFLNIRSLTMADSQRIAVTAVTPKRTLSYQILQRRPQLTKAKLVSTGP